MYTEWARDSSGLLTYVLYLEYLTDFVESSLGEWEDVDEQGDGDEKQFV